LENNEEYRNRRPSSTDKVKQQALFIKVSSLNSEEYKRAYAFCEIFSGSVPVIIYEESTGKRYKSSNFGVTVSDFTINELKNIVGEKSVVLK
ncbi:MAG: hypothetical protein IKL31_03950, partial [Ruminococcus sp.]|nr:hypothetical protein [Ruminococcus sp.]